MMAACMCESANDDAVRAHSPSDSMSHLSVQAMVPYKDHFLKDGQDAVTSGYVPEARIDVAVDRVLALKHRVGLLQPREQRNGAVDTREHGRAAESIGASGPHNGQIEVVEAAGRENGANGVAAPHGGVARRRPDSAASGGQAVAGVSAATRAAEDEQSTSAAADGIVLLKNKRGVLPLGRAEGRSGVQGSVAVVGPSAQSCANLVGGWSVHWQGPDDDSEVRHRNISLIMIIFVLAWKSQSSYVYDQQSMQALSATD